MHLSTGLKNFKIGVIAICLLNTIGLFGQTQKSDWSLDTNAPLRLDKDKRASQYDIATLENLATDQFSKVTNAIWLPTPEGNLKEYKIDYTPVVDASVAHLYTIKTYRGHLKDDPSTLVAFDISDQGINAVVLNATQSYFVEPLQAESNQYIVYYKKDALIPSHKCAMHDTAEASANEENPLRVLTPNEKYTFRLAIAASGEYSQQFGGSPVNTTMVLNAIASGVNMLNVIYLRDLGYEFSLVTNLALIFTDPATDPFDISNPFFLGDEAHDVIANTLPASDYDIGHLVLWEDLGGLAAINSVCNDLRKGNAYSSSVTSATNLWVDYVAHELGHQFGAQHTFSADECGNSVDGHRFEPGEGSSIMSYAGTCGPPVSFVNQVDPFFHIASIEEIQRSTILAQVTCAVGDTTGNAFDPSVEAGADIIIPRSTPFVLAGRARDLNDTLPNSLTYSWEQTDGDSPATIGLPNCALTEALFRFRPPSVLPYRSFPEQSEVLAGNNNGVDFEKLPCDVLDLTFALTVRDNNINFGRVNFDQILVSATNTGPFNVVNPNGGETLFAGLPNLITWDVNNTDSHCPLVDVLLSLDSGMTYTVIADAIPNDGTELIMIPDTLLSTARILISCDAPGGFGSASTFYDISDDDFKIATQPLVDNDGDNFDATIDCDDNNPNVFPGATEICNGIDDNCSGLIDDNDPLITGQTTYYIDADGDGFGDAASSTLSCAPVAGFVIDNTDCDDTDPAVNPGATEICNGIDDNCNNLVDGNDPTLSGGITTWYIDLDGDGFGDPQMNQQACIQPMGYVLDDTDCNDNNAAIHPGAAEICNNIDDDCDGLVDDNDPDLQANNIWYLDSDGDTYGGSISLVACTQPTGYVTNNLDCNDNDAAINPNGTEICNGVDDDCDGLVDSADPNVTGTTTWYADTDGDGFGNPSIPQLSCTRPTGFVSNNTDCDDNFSSINPGAIEICNGVDDDCDGLIDTDDPSLAGASIWYPDFDGDGFGNSQGAINTCTPPAGYIQVGGDCNDSNASINPSANEICNGNDDNCNGLTDDDDPGLIGATNWYADADLDGFGNPNVVIQSCTQPSGFVSNNVDCDDNNQNISPSSLEICNGIDDDCDGLVDDDDPGLSGGNTWYLDNDLDGFGNLSNSIIACTAPFGYVSNSSDCDDNDSSISPSSQEICNGIDDDCDGLVDGDDPDLQGIINWFADFDADGFGNAQVVLQACNQPQGYVPNDLDCNDNNPLINPTAVEICNGLDDDCDGLIDDADFNVQGLSTWYQDADNDGFGNIAVAQQSCFQPTGYVPNSIDCNDNNSEINPAAGEICDNGLDDDCDGLVDGADPDVIMGSTIWYIDNDGDGFGSGLNSTASCNQPVGFVGNNSDCNDNNANVNPGATELCGNNIDDDCDGLIDDNDPDVQAMSSTWFIDGDNDGFGDPNNSILACVRPQGYTANNQDCDDANAAVNPNASEICDNGIDDDCDGLVDIDDPNVIAQQWYADNDGDGFGNSAEVVTDCNPPSGFVGNSNDCDDTNPNVNPDGTEVCDNGIDDDCDGLVDDDDPSVGGSVWYEDSDGDGFGNAQVTSTGCTAPAGFIAQDGDCNDNDTQVFPGQVEICDNGIDDDCDGLIDGADPDAAAASTWYQDSDNDGFGDASNSLQACTEPMGYVQDNTDCDDTNPAINPNGIEVCNGRDDDCNGLVDIDDPNLSGVGIWFADLDEDGFGDINNTILECSQPDGYLPNNEDCDDTDPNINPDAEEICNGYDDNCDGLVDDEDPQSTGSNAIWYPDEDGDGFGDENAINLIEDCDQPAGYVSNNADCDDMNADINPDAVEIPSNGIDEDCDGQDATTAVDEATLPEVQLYPNPTLDYIQITSSTLELVNLTLYNLEGQKILENIEVTLNHRMDLRTIPSGTYFIKIDYLNVGKSAVRKVVKLEF